MQADDPPTNRNGRCTVDPGDAIVRFGPEASMTRALLLTVLAGCAPEAPSPDDEGDTEVVETDDTEPAPSAFEDVEPVARYGAQAADFTWATLDDGTFTLSDVWTPETVVVVWVWADSGYHRDAWEGGGWRELLDQTPGDTHYVWATHDTDPQARRQRLVALRREFRQAVARMEPELAEAWLSRLHFVTTPPAEMGWPAELGAPNVRRTAPYHAGQRFVGFAVDREQRVRARGEIIDWARSAVTLPFLANEARGLHVEAERRAALDVPDEVVTLWTDADSGTGWGGAGVFTEAALPDLTDVTRLELDLLMDCAHVESAEGRGDGAQPGDRDCPEWDRITNLFVCDADDTERCDVEIGRWITPYTQGGRWVHDVTPLLPLLGDGGATRRFRYAAIDNHRITLSLRLFRDGGPRPVQAVPLYTGGTLTAETNDRYAPKDVPVPAGATKVELAVIASGHSFNQDSLNCAEFCDHQHRFSVGDGLHVKGHPEAGTAYGCVDQIGIGVVPNQYGSWPFGRGGWCPGLEVALWRADVTGDVTPGADVTLDYEVWVNGAPYEPTWKNPAGGTWPETTPPPGIWVPEVYLGSWLVIYE